MKKVADLDSICKEVMKTSDFVLVQIQYLSNRLLTLVQEGKVNSELYRKTVTSIVNPETLRVTKELLTSTPITLDWERSVNINSEQSASSKVSTPDVANNNAQESFFTDRLAPLHFRLLSV